MFWKKPWMIEGRIRSAAMDGSAHKGEESQGGRDSLMIYAGMRSSAMKLIERAHEL